MTWGDGQGYWGLKGTRDFWTKAELACMAGIKRGRGRGNLGTRGRKERNPPPLRPNSLPFPTPATQAKAE